MWQVLEDSLGYSCEGELDGVVLALKAVGNMGYWQRFTPILDRCINNRDLDTEVRVAAINAYRRMPCELDVSTPHTVHAQK